MSFKWLDRIAHCQFYNHLLDDWETAFLDRLAEQLYTGQKLSVKQCDRLKYIEMVVTQRLSGGSR